MSKEVSAPVRNILLVEDDTAARESLKLLLDIDRHTVTEAANGQEALLLFSGSQYDLVITDYFMPGMCGDELAQNIKSIAPEQPILMVTAYLEKLVDAGLSADTVLGKPVSVSDLRQAMERTIVLATGSAFARRQKLDNASGQPGR